LLLLWLLLRLRLVLLLWLLLRLRLVLLLLLRRLLLIMLLLSELLLLLLLLRLRLVLLLLRLWRVLLLLFELLLVLLLRLWLRLLLLSLLRLPRWHGDLRRGRLLEQRGLQERRHSLGQRLSGHELRRTLRTWGAQASQVSYGGRSESGRVFGRRGETPPRAGLESVEDRMFQRAGRPDGRGRVRTK
jgi:hypothetical protein